MPRLQSVTSDVMPNDAFKKMNKGGELSDDELKGKEDEVQKLTDKYVDMIDKAIDEKTKEILTV